MIDPLILDVFETVTVLNDAQRAAYRAGLRDGSRLALIELREVIERALDADKEAT